MSQRTNDELNLRIDLGLLVTEILKRHYGGEASAGPVVAEILDLLELESAKSRLSNKDANRLHVAAHNIASESVSYALHFHDGRTEHAASAQQGLQQANRVFTGLLTELTGGGA